MSQVPPLEESFKEQNQHFKIIDLIDERDNDQMSV